MDQKMSENKEEFNGWANRETWAANLYIQNDQGLIDQLTERLERAFDLGSSELRGSPLEDHGSIEGATRADRRSFGISRAARSIEPWLEMLFTGAGYREEFGSEWPHALQAIASDIGSLYRIDHREIAEAILEDKLAAFDAEAAA
jgi:hypothetical protein